SSLGDSRPEGGCAADEVREAHVGERAHRRHVADLLRAGLEDTRERRGERDLAVAAVGAGTRRAGIRRARMSPGNHQWLSASRPRARRDSRWSAITPATSRTWCAAVPAIPGSR